MRFGPSDLEVAAVEVGYVAAVALLTRVLTALAKRVERWRTARGIRKILQATAEPHARVVPCDYRANASVADQAKPVAHTTWLERRRAERAARYVQKLEDAVR